MDSRNKHLELENEVRKLKYAVAALTIATGAGFFVQRLSKDTKPKDYCSPTISELINQPPPEPYRSYDNISIEDFNNCVIM